MRTMFTFSHIAKKLLAAYYSNSNRKITLPLYLSFACILLLGAVGANAQTAGDYRSKNAAGNWEQPTSWEVYDGSSWINASVAPDNTNANTITIRTSQPLWLLTSIL